MFEKLEECPSCGHPKFTNYLICTDHSISGDSFAIVKCAKCELVFTNPRPNQQSIGLYYQSDNYISHSNKSNSLVHLAYKIIREYTLSQKSKLLSSFPSEQNRLLDFGSGTGHFLNFMRTKGWQTQGVEPSLKARLMAEKKTNLRFSESLEQVKGDFDVITAWHVIEHVHDISKSLKDLRKLLSPNGHLVIAVPNINSYDASYYREYWAAYDVPRHLYHFSQTSFKSLVNSCKFKIKKIIPMKFDAYYVSMLSEKYSTGSRNYISAISTAYKSNRLASHTSEYSSLIYILTK